MNEKRPPKRRDPVAVLDVLEAVHDQPRPGLPDAQRLYRFPTFPPKETTDIVAEQSSTYSQVGTLMAFRVALKQTTLGNARPSLPVGSDPNGPRRPSLCRSPSTRRKTNHPPTTAAEPPDAIATRYRSARTLRPKE
jgi:hypothetical protein